MQAKADPEVQLAEAVAGFYADPLGFVLFAYPWDSDPTLQVCRLPEPYSMLYDSEFGPDKWACDLLTELGKQVRERGFDGMHAVPAIRHAVASGHGIGKSALIAWLVDWIMSTRPHARGVVTANTAPQLESKTWAQVAAWTKKCITGHWFTVTTGKGSMTMKHNEHPDSWRCDAQTCREENSESFAGLHAVSSTPFYLYDEASAIPAKIWEVSEGGMTDGEPMWFAFGNPTQNSGNFRECFRNMRHRWTTWQIDSRQVQITNKGFLQELIDDYGIDSDLVKVRVRGIFPSLSVKQFISTEDADRARLVHLRPEQYNFAPVIITLDNAWEGDDSVVFGKRQGLYYKTLLKMPKNDNDMVIGAKLRQLEEEHHADAVFIDAGYGTGVFSYGKTLGYEWQLVWFGSPSSEAGYLNKRAEMYAKGRAWLKAGGALDANDNTLYQDLTSIETVPRADGVVQLEAKKDMKKRGLPSPDHADAWALSFAAPVAKKPRGLGRLPGSSQVNYPDPELGVPGIVVHREHEYDPHADNFN